MDYDSRRTAKDEKAIAGTVVVGAVLALTTPSVAALTG